MKSWYCANSSTFEKFSLKMPTNCISAPLHGNLPFDVWGVMITTCWSRPVTHLSSLPVWPHRESNMLTLSPRHHSLSHIQCFFCSQSFRWTWSRRCTVLSSRQRTSVIAGPSLFDAADWTGFVCCSCPRLCQIKGQRLDSEATLLFILVQPRERSNKSKGNVVTREAERSLPTGRGSGEKLSH